MVEDGLNGLQFLPYLPRPAWHPAAVEEGDAATTGGENDGDAPPAHDEGHQKPAVPATSPSRLVQVNRPGRPPAVSRMTLSVRLLLPTLRLLTLWTLTWMQRPAAPPLLPS